MMLTPPKPETLQKIPLSAIQEFLIRRGFVQQPSPNSNMRYYEHSEMRLNDGRPVYYYFPASEHFDDYPLRVLDFIMGQARTWDYTPEEVFKELTGVALAEPVETSIPKGKKPCQRNGMRRLGNESSAFFSIPKPEVMAKIPVSAVHDFLTRRGWVQKPSSRPTSRYYEHSEMRLDDGRPLYYYFPASDHFVDYPLRVLDFIEDQSRFWELTPDAVYNELTGVALAEPVRTTIPA